MLKGTIIGLIAKLVSIGGSFFLVPLLLHSLGTSNFGIWITISSSVGLIGFMDMGISSNLLNTIADTNNSLPALKKHIQLAYLIQGVFIGVLILIFLIAFRHLNWQAILNIKNASPDITTAILITFIFFCFSLVSNTIYAIQRGFQRSDIANTWQLIGSVLYLLSIWLVILYKPQLTWIALATFGVPVVVAIVNTVWYLQLKGLISYKGRSAFDYQLASSIIKGSASFFYLQIAAVVLFQTDALILAHVLDFEAVTRYTVAAKLFSVPGIILGVYMQVLWPAYSKSFSEQNWQWIKSSFNRSVLMCSALVLLFVAGVLSCRELILKFWINNSIDIPVSLWIAFSCWIILNNCLDTNLASVLNGLNKLRIQIISSVFMLVSNVFLSVFLAGKIGVAGVVWGTVLSTLLFSTIPQYIYLRRFLNNKLKEKIINGV